MLKPDVISRTSIAVGILLLLSIVALKVENYVSEVFVRRNEIHLKPSKNNGSFGFAAVRLRKEARKPKTVLLWTSSNIPAFAAIPRTLQCESYTCTYTTDRSYLNTSHAVLFQHKFESVNPLPSVRFPWQRWVMVTHESPALGPRFDTRLSGRLNWTLTYHRSADVYFPFGFFRRIGNNDVGQRNITSDLLSDNETSLTKIRSFSAMMRLKTRSTLWMVSNCAIKDRSDYVAALQKSGLQVNVFGTCGRPESCPAENMQECLRHRYHKYRFYLAFENSRCEDYITEKPWRALVNYMVPVVLGTSMANYEEMLPPDSFLHVENFTSPAHLASFLTYLEKNDTAYRWYHRWRDNYEVQETTFRDWGCKMCRKLNEDFSGQVYMDMDSLWPHSMCSEHSRRKEMLSYHKHNYTWSKWILY